MPLQMCIRVMKNSVFNFESTYTDLPEVFFSEVKPEPVSSPEVAVFNDELAQSLGMEFSSLSNMERAELLSGNQLPDCSRPFSQAYAGHQFGHFTIF